MSEGLYDSIHLGIIMDGNGRWAHERGRSRSVGHRAGSHTVRRIVQAAPTLGISTLTLYAFSADNWGRPAAEVRALMELFERYLGTESHRCAKNGVRLNIIGRRDRLNPSLIRAIEQAEAKTAHGTRLHLRIAVDYSARAAIAAAAGRLPAGEQVSFTRFSTALNQAMHSVPPAPDVDVLIRTSGEKRLSDFLLWECAYAELIFIDKYWPDFNEDDLSHALAEFRQRDRRYGKVNKAVP